MANCQHTELTFGCGCLFITCTNPDCNAYWIAIEAPRVAVFDKPGSVVVDSDRQRFPPDILIRSEQSGKKSLSRIGAGGQNR
jgi:hypothetical protein